MKSIVLENLMFLEANSEFKVPIILIYENPLGHDGWFVGELFDLEWLARELLDLGGVTVQEYPDAEQPHIYTVMAKTLEEMESKIPPGFIRLARQPSDDERIVCTYLRKDTVDTYL